MGEGSVGGALIRPTSPKPTPWTRLRASLREAVALQDARWAMWTPAAFGGGCGLYFALRFEPPLWPLAATALVLLGAWRMLKRAGAGRAWTWPLLMLAVTAMGMANARLKTMTVEAPIAPAIAEPTTVEAWVVDVDSPGERGHRVIVAPVRIRGLAPEDTPVRLRATVRGAPPEPGRPVRMFAILNPPPPPAAPGAYDFGRNAFFEGMGGVAFALGETRFADLPPPGWRLRLEMAVNGARFDLAQRIVARLGERTGGVAAAMTTGHETWIAREDQEMMRASGLAHILSISGLHMAVVGGFAFFSVRLLVAAWPWLALRVSGKKVAAVAGLAAVAAYLVVSGAPQPAERAAITASIAFIAILLDRQAITMHALAVAAMIVLLLHPQAIVTPGFQMSFAATAALVALVEAWPSRLREISAPLPILIVQRGGAWLGAAVAASLVAGLATTPFAVQHFNRTATYGLVANLVTAPISDFVMMPFLALGALLEPIGLGAPFLTVTGWGVDAMLAIGAWTASLPGAVRTIASAPDPVLAISFLGVLFMCLWRGAGRWLGLPFAAAVLLWPKPSAPDLWIADGGAVAAYSRGPEAVALRPGVGAFASELWSRRRGLALADTTADQWVCTRFSCFPRPSAQAPVALWWGRKAPDAAALDALCRSAPVVSVRAAVASLPAGCEGRLVLDAVDFEKGAVELRRHDGGRWTARWSGDVRGDRPWSRRSDPDFSDSGG